MFACTTRLHLPASTAVSDARQTTASCLPWQTRVLRLPGLLSFIGIPRRFEDVSAQCVQFIDIDMRERWHSLVPAQATDDALRAVKLLNPKTVVPYHYDTWGLIAQDPGDWARHVKAECGSMALVLKPGASHTI